MFKDDLGAPAILIRINSQLKVYVTTVFLDLGANRKQLILYSTYSVANSFRYDMVHPGAYKI